MIDWTQATDAELAVLWYALHYDDGLFYDDYGPSEDSRLMRAIDTEANRRGFEWKALKKLAGAAS